MTVTPAPYDPGYPAGWFKSFTLAVDGLPTNLPDPSLGGGWSSFNLGGYTQTWEIVKAAGFSPRYFRKNPGEDWPVATLSRPFNPNGSIQIAGWMAWVKSNGPCTLTVTVNIDDSASLAGGGAGVAGSSRAEFTFYNVVPTTWGAPEFAADTPQGSAQKTSVETMTFTYNSYDIKNYGKPVGSAPAAVGSQFIADTKSAPQAKLRILLGGAKAADPLAALTAWNRAGTVLGKSSAAGAEVVDKASGFDPAINFWIPPEKFKIEKGSSWSVSSTPSADGSGPAEWKGTDPMKMTFDYVLTSLKSEVNQLVNTTQAMKDKKNPFEELAADTSIQPQINQLLSLLEADQSIQLLGLRMPPLVMLEFGSFMSPVSYVSKVDMTVEKFNSSGEPTRASGSISITQYPVPELLQNPTSGGVASEDQAIIYDGDSLAHVAYRYYRQPGRWRDLAAANGIDDPMRLTAGSRVGVPAALSLPARTEGGVLKAARGRDGR